MLPDLDPIREALKQGNKEAARRLLAPLLKAQPSAELWTLAALACERQEDGIKCLRRALALDPFHTQANRLLFKWEGPKPPTADEWNRLAGDMPAPIPEKDVRRATQEAKASAKPASSSAPLVAPASVVTTVPLKKARNTRKRSPWRTVGCLSFILLGSACSLFTLNMVGLINGMFTTATVLMGGPTPVSQWAGTPLEEVRNAPVVIPPSQSEMIGESSGSDDVAERTRTGGRDADVLDPGYSHEYQFEAREGDSYAIYVQFLSLGANRVSRNVVILRPDGSDATANCERNTILQGDNNVAYVCDISARGIWKVRILGRQGESVGAYFVGIERMQRT